MLLQIIGRNARGENCISFELMDPLASGHYELRVECFGWHPKGHRLEPPGLDLYHHTLQPIADIQALGKILNEYDGKVNPKFYYYTQSAPLQAISDRANKQSYELSQYE